MRESIESCEERDFRKVVLALAYQFGCSVELIGLEERAWVLASQSLNLIKENIAHGDSGNDTDEVGS